MLDATYATLPDQNVLCATERGMVEGQMTPAAPFERCENEPGDVPPEQLITDIHVPIA